LPLQRADGLDGFVQIPAVAIFGVDFQAEGRQTLHGLPVCVSQGRCGLIDVPQRVDEHLERAARRNPRIFLPHRAGGGVARIGKEALAGFGALLVYAFEAGFRQENLATRFQPSWWLATELPGHAANSADIWRDVLTLKAIASGSGAHQLGPLVGQRGGQPIHFWLRNHGKVVAAQHVADALVPGTKLVFGEDVPQAEHGHRVDHDLERLERRAADTLRRRVRRLELRVILLQRAQLPHELIELGIRDLRLVERVIAVVVVFDLAAQVLNPPLDPLLIVHHVDYEVQAPITVTTVATIDVDDFHRQDRPAVGHGASRRLHPGRRGRHCPALRSRRLGPARDDRLGPGLPDRLAALWRHAPLTLRQRAAPATRDLLPPARTAGEPADDGVSARRGRLLLLRRTT